jgi:TetR/AcrR family transcriptional regulator
MKTRAETKIETGLPGARRRGGRKAVRLLTSQPVDSAASKDIELRPRKRGDDVRERILAAALECFGAFGFEGTSTRAVAERAGLTHSLVLYHFDNKEQLWISTMDAAIGKYMRDVKSAADEGDQDPVQALQAFITQFVRLSAAKPEIHRIMTMESNQDTGRLKYIIDTYVRDNFKMVCDLIRRGQAEGTVRECDPARLYYHIIGAAGTPFTTAMEYRELTGRDIFSEKEILRTIAFIYDIVFTERQT